MIHKQTATGKWMWQFDSMSDLLRYAKPSWYGKSPYGGDGDLSVGFVGRKLPTREKAEEAANSIWEEGIKLLQGCMDEIEKLDLPELEDHKRRCRYNEDDGDEVDLDRLRSGQPFWRRSERQSIVGPMEVTIVVDMSTPAYTAPRDLMWRGAAALALASKLEAKGYTTELWLTDGGKNCFVATQVKKASDPLDASSLVNMVSGWFYRSLMFNCLWTVNDERSDIDTNRIDVPKPKDLDEFSFGARRIYISELFSRRAALQLVRDEIDRIVSGEETAL